MKKEIENFDNTAKIVKFSLLLISTFIIIITLKNLQAVFIPLSFALFFSALFSPVQKFLIKKRVPNALAVLIVLIIVFFVMYLIGYLIFIGSQSFVNEFPKYEDIIIKRFYYFLDIFKISLSDVKLNLKDYLMQVDWASVWDRLSVTKVLKTTMGTFVDFLVKLLLSLFFMLFIMTSKDKLIDSLGVSKKGKGKKDHLANSVRKIERSIGKYFAVKSLISLGTAVVGMFFISLFGIDFVLFSGLLLFFFNFIPNFGSITASFFPILIAFVEFGFSWQPFAIAIALAGVQILFGNFLEPKYIGNSLDISPIFILISLLFWAWVWGAVGMVLAIPLTSCINLIIKEIPSMKTLSILMSGKN